MRTDPDTSAAAMQMHSGGKGEWLSATHHRTQAGPSVIELRQLLLPAAAALGQPRLARYSFAARKSLPCAAGGIRSASWERLREAARHLPETMKRLEENLYGPPPAFVERLAALARQHEANSGACPLPIPETSPAPVGGVVDAGEAAPSRNSMTVAEANAKAMELAKRMKQDFFRLSIRRQAKAIGCHFDTWRKAAFYQEAQKRRQKIGRAAKSKCPGPRPAVSFTDAVEASIVDGERNEVLNQLIAEQEADAEPSPLADDPPEFRPRKVMSRKRL